MSKRLLSTLLLLALHAHVASPANLTAQAIIRPIITDGLRKDRAALIALKRTFFSFGRSRVRLWSNKVNANPCYPSVWPHLQCVAYRVTTIRLPNLGIRGQGLPSQLADMDKLWTLDLSGNDISATLPNQWGNRLAFVNLRTLNLGDCSLYGTLPAWNARGAWPELTTLNLQGNLFTGNLPLTWAGKYSPLKRLVTLDLSFNYLGKPTMEATSGFLSLPEGDADWGRADANNNPFASLQTLDLSENFFTGTLPNWGKRNVFTSLKTLDLRYNRLSGTMPSAWGAAGAFVKLQNLYLSGNGLGDSSSPGGLPLNWTRLTVPRAFPSLRYMMLFPGNEYICTWPNGETQYNARYQVVDDSLVEYGESVANMQLCPEPPDNNPPSSPQLTAAGGVLVMSWQAPTTYAGYLCGFKASIAQGATQVLAETDYIARPELTAPLTYDSSTGVYSVTTSIESSGSFTLSLATLFCDRYHSSAVTASHP